MIVAVPEPVTLAGTMAEQVRPAGTVSAILTTPENPFRAVIVIVELAAWLGLTVRGVVEVTVKSWKMKVALTE